jgi:hypothetical protein
MEAAMTFDPTLIMLSLVPSGIGFVLFMYGKKQGRMPQLVTGLAFMIYPYFAQTAASMLGVGVGLAVALYWALQAGW